MDEELAKKFYSREDIQERLLHFAQYREIGVMYDGYFGKRPDVIETKLDLKDFIRKGVRSFHCSEERWLNALALGGEKSDEDRDKNRVGWDLILDLDGVSFEYSQIVGKIIVDYLEEIGVYNVSVKFSGNKGFHLALPFECFSAYHGLKEMRVLFPSLAKDIALYLMYTLRGRISKALLEKDGSIEDIAKKYGLNPQDLTNDDEESYYFDFMKVIEIDTILITSRHLFRMPYSFNEKSGLVSVPLHPKRIMEFSKDEAKPEKVIPENYGEFEFLKYDPKFGKDGDKLLAIIEEPEDDDFIGGSYIDSLGLEETSKGYSQWKRDSLGKLSLNSGGEVFEITSEIDMKDFPKTILYVLEHGFEDGKKRALFLLMTYLYSINWQSDVIEELVIEWNKKNPEPLKMNYLSAQFSWFKNQTKKISPPRFDNENYFRQIGVPQEIIDQDRNAFSQTKAKTPLHHSFLLLKYTSSSKKNKK